MTSNLQANKKRFISQQVTVVTQNVKCAILLTFSDHSAVELDQGKTSHFYERTFLDATSPESQLKQPGEADNVTGIKEARRLSSPDSPNHNLTWSIRQEVERLMQDQNHCSSYASSQDGNAKKQPVRQTSDLSSFQQGLLHQTVLRLRLY